MSNKKLIISIPQHTTISQPSAPSLSEVKEDPLHVNCPICFESYDPNELKNIFDQCLHSFCKQCLQEYLKERIESFKVLNISCPDNNCTSTIKNECIQEILDKKTFETYETLVLKKLTATNSGLRLCPMPGCTFELPNSNSVKIRCKCGSYICNTCGKPWHQGKTCLENIDLEFQLYLQNNEIKFCIVCKTTINRVEGCPHITCPICDFEWCWKCGRQYTSTHGTNCPGVWDPIKPNQPKSWKDIWKQTSLITKILICVLLIPYSPFLLFYMWPITEKIYEEEDRSYLDPLKNKVIESSRTTKILLSILAFLFLPFISIIVMFLWSYYLCFAEKPLEWIIPWRKQWKIHPIRVAICFSLIIIFTFPLLCPVLYICWPFYKYTSEISQNLSLKKPFRSLGVLTLSLTVGIITLPFLCVLIPLIPPLAVIITSILFLFEYLRSLLRRRSNTSTSNNAGGRWIRADPSVFKYTEKGRPNGAAQEFMPEIIIPQNEPQERSLSLMENRTENHEIQNQGIQLKTNLIKNKLEPIKGDLDAEDIEKWSLVVE